MPRFESRGVRNQPLCCQLVAIVTEPFKLFPLYTKSPLLFFTSLDLSGMLQGKIQVGYSTTAENAAARKAFLVSVTLQQLFIQACAQHSVQRYLIALFTSVLAYFR